MATHDFILDLHQREPNDIARELRDRPLDRDDLRHALADLYERIAVLDQINRQSR